jgi:hypothetical protein
VEVQHVGLHDVEESGELFGDDRGAICLLERAGDPVVHDLDDRQPILHAPGDVAVGARRVVFGGEDGDVVLPPVQLAAQIERIDLRARPVSREKIVNRVKHA